MTLLLDTHAFLWSVVEPERLTERVHEALTAPTSRVVVSAVTFWEIALKSALGKLELLNCTPESLIEAALAQGFELLPLDPRVAAGFANLPRTPEHKDPFDRMLVWQALHLPATLVTRDGPLVRNGPVGLRTLW